MHPVIEATSVNKSFDNVHGVRDLTLTIPPGQMMAFVGPNGAGKTTFLKLLIGHLMPTSGTLNLWGQQSFPAKVESLRRTACVIDDYEPPWGTTVGSILSLKAATCGSFDEVLARQMLFEMKIERYRFWHRLSKGQQKWVLATAALASRADLYVMDEPAAGLDPMARRRFFTLLSEQVREHGAAAIVASHILEDLERFTDTVAMIVHGQVRVCLSLERMRDEVREVEVCRDFTIDSLPPGTQVLSHHELPQSRLLWLWHHEQLDADTPLEGELQRKHVGLNGLYSAIATNESATDLHAPSEDSGDHRITEDGEQDETDQP